jgi:hypothetical protein
VVGDMAVVVVDPAVVEVVVVVVDTSDPVVML